MFSPISIETVIQTSLSVVPDGTNGGLLILLGNGDGSFQNPVLYSTGDVASIAMGDFNRDGLLDFAVSDNSQQNVTILVGNGNGYLH